MKPCYDTYNKIAVDLLTDLKIEYNYCKVCQILNSFTRVRALHDYRNKEAKKWFVLNAISEKFSGRIKKPKVEMGYAIHAERRKRKMGNRPSFIQFKRDCFKHNLKTGRCKHTSKKCKRTTCIRIEEYNKEVEAFFIEHKNMKARIKLWTTEKKRIKDIRKKKTKWGINEFGMFEEEESKETKKKV